MKKDCFSACREEIGARSSIRTCTFVCMSDCSYLLGTARAIKDSSFRDIQFLFADACQISHLEQNRVKQSYESKRRQSLVLQLRQRSSCLACAIARLIVMLARAIFRSHVFPDVDCFLIKSHKIFYMYRLI